MGIPGTPPDAIILGALLVQGIKIGPSLFSDQSNIVYTFMFGLLIATVLMLPVGLVMGRYAYKSIVHIPKSLLVPTVAFLTILGSFAIHSNTHDTQMMVVLGVMAWVLQRFGFAPSPIVLGLVLGQIAEQGFVQTYMIGSATENVGGMFFGRPISMGIIAFSLLTLFYPLYVTLRTRRQNKGLVERTDTVVKAAPSSTRPYRDTPAMLFGVLFIVIGVMAYVQTKDMSSMGSVFPGALSAALVMLSAILIAFQIGRTPAPVNDQFGEEGKPSTARRALMIISLVAWALLMPILGFFTSSLFAFLVLIGLASFEQLTPKLATLYAAFAVAFVGAFHLLMVYVLNLRMPDGLLF